MFTKNRTEITSEQVVQELVADPNSPWHEYCGRGPITKNQVAALLRDYDIRPVVVHPTKRADLSRHGYRAAQFEDAFARFLPHEPNIRTLKRGRERGCDVRMFGCLPLDGPHREGGLLAGLRTYLPLRRHNLDATFLVPRPKISTSPSGTRLDPEPKGAPRSIRSASVPPVSDVSTVEGVPDLATGKTEASLKIG